MAVITGGASGIGLACAEKCVELGMKVVIADINEANIASACESLNAKGGVTLGVQTDVADYDSVQALKNTVYNNRDFGEVGFLFLNAGLSVGDSAYKTPIAQWKKQLDINVWGVIYGLHVFTQAMIDQGTESKIAATSSMAGLLNTSTLGLGAGTPYTVSKHSVTIMMEALCHELRTTPDCKVTAHCLCPGAVSSNYMNATMAENFAELPEEKRAERFEKVSGTMSNMMKSMMTPAKMAEVLADKIGDGNFYIVGFDGGQPKEMLHTMLQTRADDIIQERPALSHLIRDDNGKALRGQIKDAIQTGAKKIQEGNLLELGVKVGKARL